MSTEHVIPELDRKGLREFGLVTGGIVAVLWAWQQESASGLRNTTHVVNN